MSDHDKYMQELQRAASVNAIGITRRLAEIAAMTSRLSEDIHHVAKPPQHPEFKDTFVWALPVREALDKMHDDLAKLTLLAAQTATKDL